MIRPSGIWPEDMLEESGRPEAASSLAVKIREPYTVDSPLKKSCSINYAMEKVNRP